MPASLKSSMGVNVSLEIVSNVEVASKGQVEGLKTQGPTRVVRFCCDARLTAQMYIQIFLVPVVSQLYLNTHEISYLLLLLLTLYSLCQTFDVRNSFQM